MLVDSNFNLKKKWKKKEYFIYAVTNVVNLRKRLVVEIAYNCQYMSLSLRLTFISEEGVVDPNINKIQPKQNNPTISKQKVIIIF